MPSKKWLPTKINQMKKPYFIYGSLMVLAILTHAISDLGGIFGCSISILGIALSRTAIFLVLSFINFSLSLAFDNFIRVDPYFYFYNGDASNVVYLSVTSILIYCMIGWLDMIRTTRYKKPSLIDFEFPVVSPLLFWPFLTIILSAAIFVFINENFVLASAYDAYELQKYPLLEYISLIIAFMIQSARAKNKIHLPVAYISAAIFIFVALATSYRMVAIICTLSVIFIACNRRDVKKSTLVIGWLTAYVGLTYISYWRIGHFNINIENIFGYMNGRMDNTFTGVIESAMVYIDIGERQGLFENFKFLIGALLPLPNSLIPNGMLYIVDAKENYRFPGGGALAGFMIYFNFLYAIPYAVYFYIAFQRSHKAGIASGMYLITFVTITRWWLYGPYVIFKFLGVFLLLMLANNIANRIGRNLRLRSIPVT